VQAANVFVEIMVGTSVVRFLASIACFEIIDEDVEGVNIRRVERNVTNTRPLGDLEWGA